MCFIWLFGCFLYTDIDQNNISPCFKLATSSTQTCILSVLSTDGSCSYEDKKNTLSGWTFDEKDPVAYLQKGDSYLKAAVADRKIGVLVVAIAVTSDFFSYKVSVP